MALSVESLTTPVSEDEALEQVLDIFDSLGFTARAWQSGGLGRTTVEYMARFRADASLIVNSIAKSGFNELAEGLWLTLFSASHYGNDRLAGVRTIGDVTLTVEAGSGPYSKGVGEIIVMDSSLGLRYRNLYAMTLSDGGIITDSFEAEVVGSASDGPGLNDIDTLVTALAGVTVSNASDWITTNGADAEEDPELQTRNRNKWASLSPSGPSKVYELWALEAQPALTRVGVDDTNAQGTGTVGLYLANAAGGLADTGNLVMTYVAAKDPLVASLVVAAATDVPITVTYAAVHDSTILVDEAAAKTAINAAIAAYFSDPTKNPVGGVNSSFSLGGMYTAASAVSGVVNLTFSAPTASVALTVSQVAIPNITGETSTAL